MGVKCLFKCPLYFEVVVEGAFWVLLSNVMMVNFPLYFYKCSLAMKIPLYCAVALVGNFFRPRFSYHSCEIEIFLHSFP